MKILFLANRTPYPPYRGDKLKIYNLAKRLCKDHELYLVTFAQTEEDFTYKSELEKIFKEVHLVSLPKWKSALNCLSAIWDSRPLQVLYFKSAEMESKLQEVLSKNSFDAVHVQHLRMSPYLADSKSIPRILDMPDAFSLYWERRKNAESNALVKVFKSLEYKRLLKNEHVMEDYDMSLVCSKEDQEYLQKEQNISNVKLLPNGVDLTTFKAVNHDYSHNHILLFTGNMDYAPNVDAVQYFVADVLPIIHKKFPKTSFVIAGQRPVKKVTDLANDKVKVTGFVEDIAATYNEASVVVAPLRFGAGTQNKVLEAMAMGVPVVCSNIGFKGLNIKDGEGAFMRTDVQSFADEVISLLSDAERRKQVGQQGIKVITDNFGWDAIAQRLEGYFTEIKKG